MTLWYHPRCGAFKRPDVFLAGLEGESVDLEDREELSDAARLGTTHRRLPRVDGVQKSSTGRARCRCCREPIAKGSWRIPLVFYEEGYFNPSGFAHLGCSSEYFGTTDILARLIHFSDGLTEGDIAEIRALLEIEE